MGESFDIVLRTLTVSAAVTLAILLLVTRRRGPAGIPGALFCLAIAAFFVTSTRGSGGFLGPWVYPLTALCVTKAVWFWLFARALFTEDARLERQHLVIASAVAVAGTWQQLVFLPKFRADQAAAVETMFGLGVDGALAVFVIAGLLVAWRDMNVDLVERRRRLRLAFILITGIYLTATLVVQSLNVLLEASTPILATWMNMALVIAGSVVAAGFLLQLRGDSWIAPDVRVTPTSALSRAESAVLTQLQQMLANDQVHLRPGLTIGELAGLLGTGEHIVRRVINQGMGHRNFNDFLHDWRIREACDELTRPEQAREPVLAVAMKVGYGSIGAFNRAFKARVGMTPTDYRRRSISQASGAH